MTQASQAPRIGCGASNKPCTHQQVKETMKTHEKTPPLMQDETEQYRHTMAAVLLYPYTVQAVRPTRHWWLCPRVFAWFRVLMVVSLVKPPASAGPLSRIGDYLLAARGPGLFLWIRRPTTFPHDSAVTRGPPPPLFHRRPDAPSRAGTAPATPGNRALHSSRTLHTHHETHRMTSPRTRALTARVRRITGS